jgi:hypothetical protein
MPRRSRRLVQVIEHYDFGGQIDRWIDSDGTEHITRQPVYDPPLIIGRHYAGEPCAFCDQTAG